MRIAPNEVSVSHADGIRKVLLAPLEKAPWYRSQAVPDYRFQTPHSETDPRRKVARSRDFAAAYAMSSLLQSEGHVDAVIDLLRGWMDRFAGSGEPMNLGLFFTFTSSDIMSVRPSVRSTGACLSSCPVPWQSCPLASWPPLSLSRHPPELT